MVAVVGRIAVDFARKCRVVGEGVGAMPGQLGPSAIDLQIQTWIVVGCVGHIQCLTQLEPVAPLTIS